MNDPVAMAEAIVKALDFPIAENLLSEAIKPFAEQTVIQRHFDILGLAQSNAQPTGPQ